MEKNTVFDIAQIQEILPHRHPFLMVDRIVEFDVGKRIVGIKSVSINEHFFVGHFPKFPVMPGVLLIESMAQTGAILALRSPEGISPGTTIMLVGAENFRFKRQVIPGDTIRIEMDFIKKKNVLWIMDGKIFVDDQLAVSGTVLAAEGKKF